LVAWSFFVFRKGISIDCSTTAYEKDTEKEDSVNALLESYVAGCP
jgi:hypothetical protein